MDVPNNLTTDKKDVRFLNTIEASFLRYGGLKWCPGAESNHRHEDFQSSALPTELPGHIDWKAY